MFNLTLGGLNLISHNIFFISGGKNPKRPKKPALHQELLKTTHHQKTMSSQPFYQRQMKMLSFVSQFVACIMTLLVVSLPIKYSTDRHWYHSQVDTMFFSDLVTLAFFMFQSPEMD